MIVLQQDIWWCRLLLSLVDHRVRYGFVDGNVAAFPGLVNSPADVGRSRRVPHEMLHEPQQRIAEDVIVALVCRLWDRDEAGSRHEGRDHAAASSIGDKRAVRLDAVLHGAAIAGYDQPAPLEQLFAQRPKPLELVLRG